MLIPQVLAQNRWDLIPVLAVALLLIPDYGWPNGGEGYFRVLQVLPLRTHSKAPFKHNHTHTLPATNVLKHVTT